MSQTGWELAERLGVIGGAIVAFLTSVGVVINKFYKFVTWSELRRALLTITETQKASDKASRELMDERHAANSRALNEIKQILFRQERDTTQHREHVNRAFGSLSTDMAVVKQRVSHLEEKNAR